MFTGCGELSLVQQRLHKEPVAGDKSSWRGDTLSQLPALLCHLPRLAYFPPREIDNLETRQYGKKLLGPAVLLSELVGASVGVFDFCSRIPLQGDQRWAEALQQAEFLLDARGGVREKLQQ